ncbi:alkene reductase [Paraburkholderia dipogonis]|uniref:Alkene reductase n=1 Tax=Paraburkholderia dipogonis TaxID=1211383 RepID=A0A4Y8MWV3_9BURK|nr:alkene reductase [Paraburkholderia dipogonis]TFE42007.1 alkene reductase [Paraburkholderia dipogonis]
MKLFNPFELGGLTLSNRIVMAPLTRARAGEHDEPTDSMARYYAQRASAGLIVSEAINITTRSQSFQSSPGLHTDEQTEGWRKVVAKVHEAGGRIVAQLWHTGRASSFALLHGEAPVAPSAVNDDLHMLHVWARLQNGSYTRILATPSRAFTTEEVREAVREYGRGAKNARAAGFDGVEIHAANGYLIHQFLSGTTNQRTDEYGGSVEARSLFLRQVVEQVREIFPIGQIGVRISPFADYNNVRDPNPFETYRYVSQMLQELGVGYVHVADTNGWFDRPDLPELLDIVRPAYKGTIIVNGGIDGEKARRLVEDGQTDLVAFGRAFISNPDLVRRLKEGLPLSTPVTVPEDWWGGSDKGYIDFPEYSEIDAS